MLNRGKKYPKRRCEQGCECARLSCRAPIQRREDQNRATQAYYPPAHATSTLRIELHTAAHLSLGTDHGVDPTHFLPHLSTCATEARERHEAGSLAQEEEGPPAGEARMNQVRMSRGTEGGAAADADAADAEEAPPPTAPCRAAAAV